MKKALLPLAIAAVMPMSAYAVGPIDGSLYGKISVSVDSVDDGTNSTTEVNSNASRIGVKGKSELSKGLYAIYKAEFEMYVDDGDSGKTSDGHDEFEQRNIYVGLTGSAGTVIVGRHDTPAKLAQKKIDVFGDLTGDIKHTFEGENRVSNMVMYTSPKMNGLSASLMAIAAEGDDVDNDGTDDDGFDSLSYSVSYNMDNLYVALAGDQDVDNQDLMRLVAQYKMGDLKLGAMYQTNEDNADGTSKDESGYFVSAAYKLGNGFTVKGQYGAVEDDADQDEEDTLSLGVDYKLAKKTKLFAYYTTNGDTDGSTNVESEDDVFGIGMEHKF